MLFYTQQKTKAFDSLPHPILEQKLKNFDFEPSANDPIKFLSRKKKQQTLVNGAYSDWLKLEQDEPQGFVPRPLLFNLYVKDMPET